MRSKLPFFLILIGFLLIAISFGPLIKDEIWYQFMQVKNQKYVIDLTAHGSTSQQDSPFAKLISTRPISIQPINKDFSIVIEKLGVNAPIVRDVPVTDDKAYEEALKHGVAHAAMSDYPSETAGNTYLFAHTSLNFWDLGQYATVFNLLRKLEYGDRIHIFFNNDMYVYEVVNKEILQGWNTYPITRRVIEPVLTLQTCDPPGTTINRLVVTAKLVDVQRSQQ